MNINGCLWCGELERGHGRRYDSLHPSGSPLYKAPSTALRKARLLVRRELNGNRQAIGRRE